MPTAFKPRAPIDVEIRVAVRSLGIGRVFHAAATGEPVSWARVARMGERTQYTPSTFCWTDLTTTDQEGAKAFYTGLFGWEIEDLPAGEGVTYSMARMDGKDIAAISPQPQMMRDQGAPPTWNSYVSVESADDAAARQPSWARTSWRPRSTSSTPAAWR